MDTCLGEYWLSGCILSNLTNSINKMMMDDKMARPKNPPKVPACVEISSSKKLLALDHLDLKSDCSDHGNQSKETCCFSS